MKFSDLRIASKLYLAAIAVIILMLTGSAVLYQLWGGMTKALAIEHLANSIKHHATAVALHANLYYENEDPAEYHLVQAYSDSVRMHFRQAHNTVKTERGRRLLEGTIEAYTPLQQMIEGLPELMEQLSQGIATFESHCPSYLQAAITLASSHPEVALALHNALLLASQSLAHNGSQRVGQGIQTLKEIQASSIPPALQPQFQSLLSDMDRLQKSNQAIEETKRQVEIQTSRCVSEVSHANRQAREFKESLVSTIGGISLGILIALILCCPLMAKGLSQIINKPLCQILRFASSYAQGDFTQTLPSPMLRPKDELGDLARAMESMRSSIRQSINTMQAGAERVAKASQQLDTLSNSLADGASNQASSLEQVSSVIEQIGASIERNSERANEADRITELAKGNLTQVAQHAHRNGETLREVAKRIQEVEAIAFRTNILALNAAVEAARAGTHGKGFAVVAAEVRRLADRSKESATQIIQLAQANLDSAHAAAQKLNEVTPIMDQSASLVTQIAAVSLEQRHGAEQINQAVQQLNSLVQGNADAASVLASNAKTLDSEAQSLHEAMLYFRV